MLLEQQCKEDDAEIYTVEVHKMEERARHKCDMVHLRWATSMEKQPNFIFLSKRQADTSCKELQVQQHATILS